MKFEVTWMLHAEFPEPKISLHAYARDSASDFDLSVGCFVDLTREQLLGLLFKWRNEVMRDALRTPYKA